MAWQVRISKPAERYLGSLPVRAQRRAAGVIDALAEDPRPPGCRKLAGSDDLYRVRLGDYRLVYQVRAHELLVLVVIAGPRGDVYEKLKRRLR
ncbi:MAG TPA: type II toxin-antitoxin system RelE/ParE family toxin [Planctomycetota bacterium]|nr:type II toxin-antitoxin system RelE/ParE family toxin [Planctomycetota bacterium]